MAIVKNKFFLDKILKLKEYSTDDQIMLMQPKHSNLEKKTIPEEGFSLKELKLK